MFTTSGCSLHQGVHYIRVFITSGCSLHQGVHYIRVFTTSGCSLHQGVHYIRVFTTSGCSLHQGVHYIRVFTTSGFIHNRVNRCTYILRSMFVMPGSSWYPGFIIERVSCIQSTCTQISISFANPHGKHRHGWSCSSTLYRILTRGCLLSDNEEYGELGLCVCHRTYQSV